MTDGETINTEQAGTQTNTISESDNKPVSLYDKTEAIVTRQEKANEEAKLILDRQEKLHANQRLAGTGSNVESKTVSPEEKKVNDAAEYFKGTQLEDAIRKANEKK